MSLAWRAPGLLLALTWPVVGALAPTAEIAVAEDLALGRPRDAAPVAPGDGVRSARAGDAELALSRPSLARHPGPLARARFTGSTPRRLIPTPTSPPPAVTLCRRGRRRPRS